MPFDPDSGAGSPAFDAILRGPAAALTAVALVAGAQARASGWGARAALALARRWPAGRRVVLVDLDLERPMLHEQAGVSNDEGVCDVIEFGASLHRVGRELAGRASGELTLVPTGPFVGDPASLLQSVEWRRLLREAVGRHETMLLYVPADEAGMREIVGGVGATIVLAEAGEADAVVARLPRQFGILGVAVAPAPVATPAAAVVEERPVVEAAGAPRLSDAEFERIRLPTEAAAREELIADLRARQRAARMAPPADAESIAGVTVRREEVPAAVVLPAGGETSRALRVESAADDVAIETIVPTAGPPLSVRRRRFGHPIAWTITIALLASALAGAWHFWRIRPQPVVEAPAEPAPAPIPTPAVPLNATVENAAAFSVALEAHQNLATAFDRVDVLASSRPEVPFYIAPLERGGTLYYHVMAGSEADSARALAVRDTLVAHRITTGAAAVVRHTPLALLIGDYSTREGAAEQIGELRRLDIPAYTLPGLAADGQALYRVYVGGFAGPAEADVVRQLLRAAGIRDTLVNRTRSSTP